MSKGLIYLDMNRCVPGSCEHLHKLGYDVLLVEGNVDGAVRQAPLTLRERAAVAAMAALLPTIGYRGAENESVIVKNAVAAADALVEALRDG